MQPSAVDAAETLSTAFRLRYKNSLETFVVMRVKRHSADYDPDATFLKSDVIQDIDTAEDAIKLFSEAPRADRRAFAIYVLLDIRND